MNKTENLVDLQKQYMDNDALKKGREKIHESWFNENTVDYWRHKRMYETILPIATAFKTEKWLTVGDGRFGLDSIRLKNIYRIQDIFPTDIAINMLSISKEKGYIPHFGIENAEKLSFNDNQFNIVFCKESFHHFPRPYQALYEMIRVCSNAVILIEPADQVVYNGFKTKKYLLSAFKLLLSKIIKKNYIPYFPALQPASHKYEEAGNYMYAVSARELERLIHGMELPALAAFRFNDVYVKGCEFENATNGNIVFDTINEQIKKQDELFVAHPAFYQPNMITTILFKQTPDEALKNQLVDFGFTFSEKSHNPFLTGTDSKK